MSEEFGPGEWRATRIEGTYVADFIEIEDYSDDVEVGETWNTVEVWLYDANWNLMDVSAPVTIWVLDENDVPVPLSGTTTVTSEHGIARFDDISTTTSTGEDNGTLYAQAGIAITDEDIYVYPGDATVLEFLVQPTDAVASDDFFPFVEVEIQDPYGNALYYETVDLDIGFNAGAGNLDGDTTISTSDEGVAVFNDGLYIDNVGVGYTLVASYDGVVGYSAPFDITADEADGLAFTVQPGDTVAGATIPQVTVVVTDDQGNFVGGVNGTVDVILIDGDPGATLSGTTTVNLVGSVAVFDDLSVDITSTGYNLEVTSSVVGLGTTQSNNFEILPGAPAALAFLTQPTDAARMAPMAAFSVEILDALGNRVTSATDNITVAIEDDRSAGAILSGTKTVAAVNGLATFNTLSIHLPEADYTLMASMAGMTDVESDPFNITPTDATPLSAYSFTITGQVNTGAGLAIPLVTVQVVDFVGTPVTAAGLNVSLAIGNDPTAGATLNNMTPDITDVNGVATFSGLTINEAGDLFTLLASAATLNDGESGQFNILPAAPDYLGFTVEPTDAAGSVNIAPAIEVTVYDQYDNICTNDFATGVTLSVASGIGTLDGGTVQTASAGVATFSAVSIDELDTFTLDAVAGGVTTATSASFVVAPGAPASVAFIDGPPASTVAGVAFASDVTVEILDAVGNPVTSSTATVNLSVTGNPGILCARQSLGKGDAV